jgi:long-subunit acyl-CoA synthetase (AMP-forming)
VEGRSTGPAHRAVTGLTDTGQYDSYTIQQLLLVVNYSAVVVLVLEDQKLAMKSTKKQRKDKLK